MEDRKPPFQNSSMATDSIMRQSTILTKVALYIPSPGKRSTAQKFCLLAMLIWIKLSIRMGLMAECRSWFENTKTLHFSFSRVCVSVTQQNNHVFWDRTLGLYSLSGRTSYRNILWSLKAARLNILTISAALLPRCLSGFRTIGKV